MVAEETRSLSENSIASNVITPPALRDNAPFEIWKKEIRICKALFIQVKQDKQALGIIISLEGKASKAVLETVIDELNKKMV